MSPVLLDHPRFGLTAALTPEAVALLMATIEENPYIPISPSDQQAVFLTLPVREALYGGAAGGGKTYGGVMGALQYVEDPSYRALILMRSYADLTKPGAPLDVAAEWLTDTDATYNQQAHRWRFPSGAYLDFGYLQTESDKYNYKTAAYHYIYWDEVTQFSRSVYTYLFSRQRRRSNSWIPIRTRSGTNPDGPGFDWVKQRFIVEGAAEGHFFIPARLEDNPFIDQADYELQLNQLDPITRERLRWGNWEIVPSGLMFRRHWFNVVRVAPATPSISVRFWDMAATEVKEGKDPDWAVGTRMSYLGGEYFIENQVAVRTSPGGVEKVVKQTAALDGPNVRVFMEQEPGSSGKIAISHYAANVLPGLAFQGIPSTGSKTQRAIPLSIAAESGRVNLVVGPWVGDFLDQSEVFGTVTASHDDRVDSAAGAFNQVSRIAGTTFGRLS